MQVGSRAADLGPAAESKIVERPAGDSMPMTCSISGSSGDREIPLLLMSCVLFR